MMGIQASFPPFGKFQLLTRRGVASIYTPRQLAAMDKVSADLQVACVALDAAINRIKVDHLPINDREMYIAMMWFGATRQRIGEIADEVRNQEVVRAVGEEGAKILRRA